MKNYEKFELEDFLADESFIIWVLRSDSADHQFWNTYLAQHPHQQEIINRAGNILLSLQPLPAAKSLSEQEVATLRANILLKTTDLKTRITLKIYKRNWFKVAAVLLILISVGLFFRLASRSLLPANHLAVQATLIHFTNNAEHTKMLKLSDGSLVILYPGSKISYLSKFSNSKRDVNLTGEAFFEVRKDKKRPFTVYSGRLVTRVVGTSFKVRAFPSQDKFSVTVNTGRVEVSAQDSKRKILSTLVVLPNQEVMLAKIQGSLNKEALSSPLVLSQEVATRVFSFNNAPLSEIISKLEDAYKVNIVYDHKKYAKATVTASLAQLPLDEKIRMICKAIDAECRVDNGQIIIN